MTVIDVLRGPKVIIDRANLLEEVVFVNENQFWGYKTNI